MLKRNPLYIGSSNADPLREARRLVLCGEKVPTHIAKELIKMIESPPAPEVRLTAEEADALTEQAIERMHRDSNRRARLQEAFEQSAEFAGY